MRLILRRASWATCGRTTQPKLLAQSAGIFRDAAAALLFPLSYIVAEDAPTAVVLVVGASGEQQ